MARGRRRAYTPDEIRAHADANRAADAYNAGYRRGMRGLPKDGRYVAHPRFEVGYADGAKARETNPAGHDDRHSV